MVINKDSWHYKFVTFFDSDYGWRETTNLCCYSKKIVGVFFVAATMLIGSLVTIYSTILWFAYVAASLMVGVLFALPSETIGGFVVSVILLVALLLYIFVRVEDIVDRVADVYLKSQNNDHRPAKEPSLFSVWWKFFKEKTCVFIEFK